ncbi:MAG: cupin [bacterium]|nr:cupin [bacterium]
MSISSELVKKVDEGKVVYLEKEIDIKSLDWNAHPDFKGVFRKHLVKGESTDDKFSLHLVKVESGCEIGKHIHEDKWELHEIISGVGKGVLANKEICYNLGAFVVIPEGIEHKVIAGEEDLYLLSMFAPALV